MPEEFHNPKCGVTNGVANEYDLITDIQQNITIIQVLWPIL